MDDTPTARLCFESGRGKVYVSPYPEPTARWQASNTGGAYAQWSRDGLELFYLAADGTLMAVPVEAGTTAVTLGAPRPLFRADILTLDHNSIFGELRHVPHAVSADGQRFLVNERLSPTHETPTQSLTPPQIAEYYLAAGPIAVIVNWNEGL